MSDQIALITPPSSEDDKLHTLLTPESEAFREAIKQGDLQMPLMRVFSGPHTGEDADKELELVVSILFKPHNDEASYRNALMEIAMCLPMFACMAVSMWYRTSNDDNGMMYQHFAAGIGGCFLDDSGDNVQIDEFNANNIDTETVIVLEKFVKIPSDATFAASTVQTLRRRGHGVTVHTDLDKLYRPV